MTGIVLVGFMGTGKTLIGQTLAKRLQLPFEDTDDLIVKRVGKPISRIFSEDGEPVFREAETHVLEQMLDEPKPRIVSTGGGIVLAERNWPLLRKLGFVVCLHAEPETILQRVGTAQDRPLLAGTREEVNQRIRTLLNDRAEAYAKADWKCGTDQRSPQMIVEDIVLRARTR